MDTTIMPQNLQGASAARSGSPLVGHLRGAQGGTGQTGTSRTRGLATTCAPVRRVTQAEPKLGATVSSDKNSFKN